MFAYSFIYMWWFWLALALIFFLPVGYGWGYRGWGPPYPSYVQRRRMQYAAGAGTGSTFNHQAWGRRGDLIWGLLLLEGFLVVMLFWR